MANIYIRKLFPHDITHEVSLTTNIVYEYFNIRMNGIQTMTFKGKTSGDIQNVTINNVTDPRFGGGFKHILRSEKNYEVGNIIIVCNCGNYYSLETITPTDERFAKCERLINSYLGGND